ncbi:hypothetical protein ICA16_14580 [Pseudomonas anatoliensis]|uniref:hypothetical protein n=1 Tax=Pseudomonas anatoliensis TaxID=2710589 RepID=UPI001B339993|nr:hypothetical protein [Pseudomonas anatoliensis]MBP5956895.1 hypothetical protein [Pseudomonas anatoliensis]
MTVYEKNTNEDPGRAALKAVRAAKSARMATAPELQGLLPDVTGDEKNKLPKARQGVDNDVIINSVLELNPPPAPGRRVELQLLWDDVPVGIPVPATTPIPPMQTLVLPSVFTTAEGPHRLGYQVKYVNDVWNFDTPVQIIIDKTAPNRDAQAAVIELPAEYADLRITKERLDANPVIELTIPLHSDRRTGDVAGVFMGASYPGAFIGSYQTPDDGTSAMTVNLSKHQVENGREGERIIYYQWIDRVGNEAQQPSVGLSVVVELTAAPANLKPLEVPEAPDPDNLISIKDAYPDVAVVIQEYDNIGPLDEVALLWDGIPQPRKRSSDGFPMIFDVPYGHVKRNGLGPRPISVTYSIWRGAKEYPELTAVPVNIDLRRPGTLPPDPENPEVGNPNLAQVSVQAAVTIEPNKFELIDAGQDGTATTVIDAVRETGDIYQLYWGGGAVPGGRYEVDGSELDDDPVIFTIPHAFITAQGNNPVIPVHYEITNPLIPDSNPNPSLRQPVSVYVIAVTLPKPKVNFTVMSGGDEFLTCSSLKNVAGHGHVAVVTVAGGEPLAAGLKLEFTWDGVGWDGTAPVPLPSFKFDKTLSGNEHIDGFEVYLPYATALEPIQDGSGSIRYVAEIAGREESSDQHEVQVVARTSSGGACPIP